MKCKTCGFIYKGNARKCPHCGEELVQAPFLEREIYFFNWFYIKVRDLITIISLNAFILFFALEIILNNTMGYSSHLYPWVFLGIFMIERIIYTLAIKKNNFFVSYGIMILFSVFLFVSYKDTLIFNTYKAWPFIIGIVVPMFNCFILLLTFIHSAKFRYFDIFTILFNSVFAIIFASTFFGLSYIPTLGFASNPALRMTSLIGFVVSLFFAIQFFMFSVLNLGSKFNKEKK